MLLHIDISCGLDDENSSRTLYFINILKFLNKISRIIIIFFEKISKINFLHFIDTVKNLAIN